MAKKKVRVNFVLTIAALATAVLSFVSLAFNFILQKTTTKSLLGLTTNDSTSLNLGEWCDGMKNMQEANETANSVGLKDVYNLTGWNLARVFLVVTLILVGVLAVMLVIKFFMNNRALRLATIVFGALSVVSAVVFAIAMFVGCGAVSGTLSVGSSEITIQCLAHVGVYFLTLCAMATGVLAAVGSRKN